jgi:hypothetical protein
MTGTTALLLAIGIVLVLSTITVATLYQPLQRQLMALHPADTPASFWMRAMAALIYLLPLYAVVGRLPRLIFDEYTGAEVARRAIAGTAVTLATIVILIVIVIGLRLSMMERPGKFDYPPAVR